MLLMSVLLAWTTSVFAQITREQADAIVLSYLQNEGIQPDLLYVNTNTPKEEGITLTTSNEETIKAKYACWVYYLNESEFSQSRYLFVKADNGHLLEIIANNDLGPDHSGQELFQWQIVKSSTGITGKEGSPKLLYPNPVKDMLTLPCTEGNTRVEIYDLKGTRLFSEVLLENACQLDVSFLSAGIYMVNVNGKTYKITKD